MVDWLDDLTGDWADWGGDATSSYDWDLPGTTNDYSSIYGDLGNSNYYNWDLPGTTTNTPTNSSFWNELVKVFPALAGAGLSTSLGALAQKGTQDKTTTGEYSQAYNWLPGTQDLAAMVQGGYLQGVAPQPAINPYQQAYWGGTAGNILAGTDPNSISALSALQMMGMPQGALYPQQQWGEAQTALEQTQGLARTQFPQQIEQLTGWNRGRRGLANQQEDMAVANFLAQLSQQQQTLSQQKAASMQAALQGEQAARQFGTTQFPQLAPSSLQNVLATQQYLGYPESAQKAEEARQMQYWNSLKTLLDTYMNKPTSITGGGITTSTTGTANPWLSALSAMAAPYGQKATNLLMGA